MVCKQKKRPAGTNRNRARKLLFGKFFGTKADTVFHFSVLIGRNNIFEEIS